MTQDHFTMTLSQFIAKNNACFWQRAAAINHKAAAIYLAEGWIKWAKAEQRQAAKSAAKAQTWLSLALDLGLGREDAKC